MHVTVGITFNRKEFTTRNDLNRKKIGAKIPINACNHIEKSCSPIRCAQFSGPNNVNGKGGAIALNESLD